MENGYNCRELGVLHLCPNETFLFYIVAPEVFPLMHPLHSSLVNICSISKAVGNSPYQSNHQWFSTCLSNDVSGHSVMFIRYMPETGLCTEAAVMKINQQNPQLLFWPDNFPTPLLIRVETLSNLILSPTCL